MTPDDIRFIEQQLDELKRGQAAVIIHLERLNGTVEAVSARMTLVELWRARIEGAAATLRIEWVMIAAVAGAVAGLIAKFA